MQRRADEVLCEQEPAARFESLVDLAEDLDLQGLLPSRPMPPTTDFIATMSKWFV